MDLTLPSNPALLGLVGSFAAGMCTAVGAVALVLFRRPSELVEDMMLASAAGIMLAASIFSLILPGIELGAARFGNEAVAALVVLVGVVMGGIALALINRLVPHEHFLVGHEGPDAARVSRIWLFVIAITIHNFPEGMAVGVGFAGSDLANGMSLATGIGLQNMPEGMAVAASLRSVGYTMGRSIWIGALTGLIEPVGGLFGGAAVAVAGPVMPWTLGFAGGAMLFIISHEIIPETHRRGYALPATFSLMGGFCVMTFLDVVFG